jgi:hypothetical protein
VASRAAPTSFAPAGTQNTSASPCGCRKLHRRPRDARSERTTTFSFTVSADGEDDAAEIRVERPTDGALARHALPAPTRSDVTEVAHRTAARVERILRVRGRSLDPQKQLDESFPDARRQMRAHGYVQLDERRRIAAIVLNEVIRAAALALLAADAPGDAADLLV